MIAKMQPGNLRPPRFLTTRNRRATISNPRDTPFTLRCLAPGHCELVREGGHITPFDKLLGHECVEAEACFAVLVGHVPALKLHVLPDGLFSRLTGQSYNLLSLYCWRRGA